MNMIVQGLPVFLLIFCRITAFFVVSPIFSSRTVPSIFKVGLGFFVSLLVYFAYGINEAPIELTIVYVLMIIRELLIGIFIGFIVYLFFTVAQIAGGFTDMQIGFAMANVVDPHTGVSAPLIGNFKYMILLVFFLAMDGHHFMLQALMNSYNWVPLSNDFFAKLAHGDLSSFLVQTLIMVFVLAFQLGAPLIVAMFLADVGLGFLAKTAPQFNVFVIGIPLKLLIGLFLLFILLPTLSVLFGNLFSIMFEAIEQWLIIMSSPIVSS